MKKLLLPSLLFFCFLVSCGGHKPIRHFTMKIDVPNGMGTYSYTLTDTSLSVYDIPGVMESRTSGEVFHATISDNDSIRLVAALDNKSFDCKKQHALVASGITFTNDSGSVQVSPGINHPKELDYAVDIINSLVPDKYKLMFEDMQRAGDPDQKMNI